MEYKDKLIKIPIEIFRQLEKEAKKKYTNVAEIIKFILVEHFEKDD